MLRRSSPLTQLLLAATLVAVGCTDSTGPDTSDMGIPSKGFTLLLTDAPGDFKAAVVTISDVSLVGSSEVDLLSSPVTVNLLTLQNSISTLVAGFDVPKGSYSQLRMVVTGAYVEVERAGGGTEIFASSPNYAGLPAGAKVVGDLHMPSFGSSGLKIDLPGGNLDIGEGQTVVLIDFDVKESFGHEAGKSGKWVMHPVVKATNVTFGGNVLARLQLGSGVTLPPLNGQPITLAAFTAQLTPVGGGTVRTLSFSDPDNDGTFEAMFKGLLPGQYSLTVLLPTGLLGTFSVTLPVTLTVASSQTVTQLIQLTTATPPASIRATLVLGSGVTLPSVGSPPVATTLGQFRAQLTPPGGGTPVVVTFTDANNDLTWEANFPNLTPGSYQLALLAPTGVNATYNPTSPVTVALASGAAETRAFTVTAAVPTP